MEDKEQQKYIKMTTEPVEKLICKLSIPTIIAMLVTSFYNIADTLFVSKIGTEATAGVGLIFPIMTIIQAVGFFFGQGSGNCISRMLGAKEHNKAEKMAATGCFCALIIGVLIMIFGLCFRSGTLYILGAREELISQKTIQYASDYFTLILIGAPFLCMSCVFNNQLRFQGNAIFAMIGLVSGAVINIGLDPLLIFVFNMEVAGAALATTISQIISCVILFLGTLKSDNLKIKLKNFTPNLFYLKNIAVGGTPSLFRQGLASIATLFLNTAVAAAVSPALSDAAVAAFSVVSRVMMFAFSALLGFCQGFQPVCGFNYGAKKYARVKRSYSFCVKIGIITLFAFSCLGFIFAEQIIALFRDDASVIAFGTVALRCQCASFTLMAVVCMTNMIYQNIGRVLGATVLALARQGLIFIPCVLILPNLFSDSIWGLYLAQPVSDILTFCIALPLGMRLYNELKRKETEQIESKTDAE